MTDNSDPVFRRYQRRRLMWTAGVATLAVVMLAVSWTVGWLPVTAVAVICGVVFLAIAVLGWTQFARLS